MIHKLHIKNFKSIVDKELPLSNLTVLAGVNSSGKSSVIQAFRIMHKASLLNGEKNGILPELIGHGSYEDLQSKEGSSKEGGEQYCIRSKKSR